MSGKLSETNAADTVDGEGEAYVFENGEMSRVEHFFNDLIGTVGIDIESRGIGSASARGEANQFFRIGSESEQRDVTIRQRQ